MLKLPHTIANTYTQISIYDDVMVSHPVSAQKKSPCEWKYENQCFGIVRITLIINRHIDK